MTEKELEQMEADPEGFHSCPKCGKEKVPNERALVIKTMRCCECTPQGFKPKALYFSAEREGEGGCLVVLQDEESFKAARRAYHENDDDEKTGENLTSAEKLTKEE